jgi:hypothetical protein
MFRLELLNVRADLGRELGILSLSFSKWGLDVHRVSGLGSRRATHAEPAPHGEPAV